jgi:hypothetical protein
MLFLCLFCLAGNSLVAQKAQETQDDANVVTEPEPKVVRGDTYMGLGFGLDYGGIGFKFEYLPIKYISIFVGGGYNMDSFGCNAGCIFKMSPSEKICPNILAFYGNNGVFKGEDWYASQYDMTSYGFTLGFSLDIQVGHHADNISLGLLIPIRSKKFNDNYYEARNDSNMEMKSELWPIAISIGYNFAF